MQLFNQYSAVFSLIFPLGLLAAAILLRNHTFISRIAGGISLLLFMLVGYFLLQPESNPAALNEVETLLAVPDGRPMLLELYSDY